MSFLRGAEPFRLKPIGLSSPFYVVMVNIKQAGLCRICSLLFDAILSNTCVLFAEVQGCWAGLNCLSWSRVWKWQFSRLGCQGSSTTCECKFYVLLAICLWCISLYLVSYKVNFLFCIRE